MCAALIICCFSISVSSDSDFLSTLTTKFRALLIARANSFICTFCAKDVLSCVFWIRNSIRNVITVVGVLMSSCHVSLNWNIGPVHNHTTTSIKPIANPPLPPATFATFSENFSNIRTSVSLTRSQRVENDTRTRGIEPLSQFSRFWRPPHYLSATSVSGRYLFRSPTGTIALHKVAARRG